MMIRVLLVGLAACVIAFSTLGEEPVELREVEKIFSSNLKGLIEGTAG